MIVFPALHLKDGKIVSAANGSLGADPSADPVARAMTYASAGAAHLHIVDLDAAPAGGSPNREALEGIIAEFPGYVQLHASGPTPATVADWFAIGVARVVIGVDTLESMRFVSQMAREWEGGIVAAVDVNDGLTALSNLSELADMPVQDFARRMEDTGVASLLVRDIARAGHLVGGAIDATLDLARRTTVPLIASGGIKGLDDIHVLALHAREGIEGVICHRALEEGLIDLGAALALAARA